MHLLLLHLLLLHLLLLHLLHLLLLLLLLHLLLLLTSHRHLLLVIGLASRRGEVLNLELLRRCRHGLLPPLLHRSLTLHHRLLLLPLRHCLLLALLLHLLLLHLLLLHLLLLHRLLLLLPLRHRLLMALAFEGHLFLVVVMLLLLLLLLHHLLLLHLPALHHLLLLSHLQLLRRRPALSSSRPLTRHAIRLLVLGGESADGLGALCPIVLVDRTVRRARRRRVCALRSLALSRFNDGEPVQEVAAAAEDATRYGASGRIATVRIVLRRLYRPAEDVRAAAHTAHVGRHRRQPMEAEGEHPDVIWATPSLAGATVSPHATPLM